MGRREKHGESKAKPGNAQVSGLNRARTKDRDAAAAVFVRIVSGPRRAVVIA